MNFAEARKAWGAEKRRIAQLGVILPDVRSYLPEEFAQDFELAMDAQPSLTTAPNAGIPAFLTLYQDPQVIRVLFSPNKAADIFGENRKGTWLDETMMFTLVEHTGEVSSYGDWNENGSAGANTNWPQRQSYLFQTMKQYGDRELERAGLAKLSWVSEQDMAAAMALNKFMNLTYFYGVQGLENYGLLNDPSLSAALTPAPKARGGVAWFVNGRPNASANEVYDDIVSLYSQTINQGNGTIEKTDKMTLAMSPDSEVALTFTNSFGVNVSDLLKKNYPNLTVKTAMQYGELNASNNQGNPAGNFMQLICDAVEGQDTGFCGFNEKMRAHPIIRAVSSYKQKTTGGTWGAIIKQPFAISSMIGI